MDKQLESFFRAAKEIRLSESERSAARAAVLLRMASPAPERSFAAAAKGVHLTAEEKGATYERLQTYMRMRPAALKPGRAPARGGMLRKAALHPFPLKFLSSALIASLLIVSTGGGLAYAAESALPGDLLYPLKVDVTEPLRERLLPSEQQRVAWHLQRLERRFTEAQALLAREDLDPALRGQMQARIDQHVEHLDARLARLAERDAETASELGAMFEFSIEDHEPELRRFLAEPGAQNPAPVVLWQRRAMHARQVLERQAARHVTPARVEEHIAEVAKHMEKAALPAMDSGAASYVRENLEEARVELEQGNSVQAFEALQRGKRALRHAEHGRRVRPERHAEEEDVQEEHEEPDDDGGESDDLPVTVAAPRSAEDGDDTEDEPGEREEESDEGDEKDDDDVSDEPKNDHGKNDGDEVQRPGGEEGRRWRNPGPPFPPFLKKHAPPPAMLRHELRPEPPKGERPLAEPLPSGGDLL